MNWEQAPALKVGDTFTMMVPKRDLWSRVLRLFGRGVEMEEKTFRVTATSPEPVTE